MNLSHELAKQAKKNGICEDWYLALKNEKNIDKMLEMYVKGIDFCLSNDYPSNHFIAKNFKGKMEKYGIHLDEVLCIESESKVIALGKCTGTIELFNFDVSEIFVKNECNLTLVAEGNSFVMIDVFDNSNIIIHAYDNAKFCVNRYGGTVEFARHNLTSQVKIIEKNKKTY